MNVRVDRSFASKALAYFRDGRVATWRKMTGLVALAYTVMPIDAVPDFVPLFGWLDDLGVMSAAVYFVTREINRHARGRGEPTAVASGPRREKEINPRR